MKMSTSNINSYGNSVNTASEIHVDSQQIHIGGAAKKFDVKSKHHEYNQSNNRSENNTTHISYHNSFMNFPEIPQPRFLAHILGYEGGEVSPPLWNELRKMFVDEGEYIRAQEQSQNRWAQTLPSIRKLDKATSGLKCRLNDKLDLQDTQHAVQGCAAIRLQLKRACKHHRRGFGLQNPTVSALYDVDKVLDDYCKWLRRLENDEHSSCLCDAIQLIIAAVGNEYRVDDFILQSVAKSLQQFGHAQSYLRVNRSHWTSQMEGLTLRIFEVFAAMLEKLLSQFSRKFLEDMKEDIEDYINLLGDDLRMIDILAKNRNIPPPQNSLRLPKYDTPIGIANSYRRLLSESCYDSKDAESGRRRGKDISHLLGLLAYNELDTAKDINTGRLRANVTRLQLQCLSGLSKGRTFQDWLTKKQSTALLINGNKKSFSRISPLSHLCAQMAEQYHGWQQFIFLNYFCGFFDKKQRDPGTMLYQLIGQLITTARRSSLIPDLRSPDRHSTKKIKSRDVPTLCKTFRFLIEQLEDSKIVVFCVIDSISTFEDNSRRDDNEMVLKTLLNIVRQRQSSGQKMLFKLMVTDNRRSLYAWKHFELHERVEMSENARGGASTDLQLPREKLG